MKCTRKKDAVCKKCARAASTNCDFIVKALSKLWKRIFCISKPLPARLATAVLLDGKQSQINK